MVKRVKKKYAIFKSRYSVRVDKTCTWWDHYKHLVWELAVFRHIQAFEYVVAIVRLKNPLESNIKNTFTKSLRGGDYAYDVIDYRWNFKILPKFINYKNLRIFREEIVDGLLITTVGERD